MDNKEFKQTRLIIVLIAIIIILVFAVGFLLGTKNNKLEPKLETNRERVEEQKKDETEEVIPKKEEKADIETENKSETNNENKNEDNKEENIPKIDNKGFSNVIESKGERKEAKISLNGKSITLTLENNTEKRKDSIFSFGNTKINFLSQQGTGPTIDWAPSKAEYQVIKGEDSKEYLGIYYQSDLTPEKILLIINDDAKIIGNFNSLTEIPEASYSCWAVLTDYKAAIYKYENGSVYFYKSINNKTTTGYDKIKLDIIKLRISNNKVEEIIDGKIDGMFSSCN